jgi:hypothetical protein
MSYATDKAINYTSYDSNLDNALNVEHNNGEVAAVVETNIEFGNEQNLVLNGKIEGTAQTITTLDTTNINEDSVHGNNK